MFSKKYFICSCIQTSAIWPWCLAYLLVLFIYHQSLYTKCLCRCWYRPRSAKASGACATVLELLWLVFLAVAGPVDDDIVGVVSCTWRWHCPHPGDAADTATLVNDPSLHHVKKSLFFIRSCTRPSQDRFFTAVPPYASGKWLELVFCKGYRDIRRLVSPIFFRGQRALRMASLPALLCAPSSWGFCHTWLWGFLLFSRVFNDDAISQWDVWVKRANDREVGFVRCKARLDSQSRL